MSLLDNFDNFNIKFDAKYGEDKRLLIQVGIIIINNTKSAQVKEEEGRRWWGKEETDGEEELYE